MKKIISILGILVLLVFISFFTYTTYQYYIFLHSDDPIDPYLEVTSGSATIVRSEELAIDMGSGDTYGLIEGDIIITRDESVTIIHWPDKSITRLGPESRLSLEMMKVATDYSEISIEFSLEKGKAWSRVVRTMYPGSFFRVKLPKSGVTAGVRGSVFDINLDASYIESIDHGLTLSDSRGRRVALLPGEAVDATDILRKVTGIVKDRFWKEWNNLEDLRVSEFERKVLESELATMKLRSQNLWDTFVRVILQQFHTFQGLEIIDILKGNTEVENITIDTDILLRFYQRFQDKKFVQEREQMRLIFTKLIPTNPDLSGYIESFARGALWDSMSFSGMSLISTKPLLESYTKEMDARIRNVIQVLPISELGTKARETLRSLLE